MRKLLRVIFLFAVPVLLGQGDATKSLPQVRKSSLPAAPIYSGDGAIAVFSSQERKAYRGPILIFVNRTRELFQSALNLKLGSQKCPLEIRIGDKSDGDGTVLTARLRDAQGNLREQIELPDPEAADLVRFRRAIAVAFLRAWMVDAGGTDETMQDLPGWLIDGTMRYIQGLNRQEDLDRTYLLWSQACLPVAEELYSFNSYAATKEPGVASVLAGWFLEKRGYAFKILLKDAASGKKWSTSGVAQMFSEDFTGDFDRMLDMRMLDLGNRVIQPGLTTAGIVRRFRSELLLFPSDYGMIFSQTNACCTFREAIDLSDRKEIRQAALVRRMKVGAAAAGRDGTLLAVSERYEQFLRSLAEGEKPSKLMPLLMQAESMRRDLENRVGAGYTLKRKPD